MRIHPMNIPRHDNLHVPEARSCPVCHTSSNNAKLFLENSIDATKLSQFSFSSRKTPEFMSHRLVQCPVCDLVYASSPPNEAQLAQAYHSADYDSSEEANDAAAAYMSAIRPRIAGLVRRQNVLEIGTGNGIFLEYLSHEGFTELVGVEPSPAAIASAPPHRREWIREGMFNENDFAPASFDLICCFMTMEHVRDPTIIARAALRLLRTGGVFVTVTHDYRSRVNRLLGKRSPIIDIEHLQLFSSRSLEHLFEGVGYTNVIVSPFVNSYSLKYWMRLAPLPQNFKKKISALMAKTGLEKMKIGVNVGNVIATGIKNA
jgi:SAM-dependent methyltransferase